MLNLVFHIQFVRVLIRRNQFVDYRDKKHAGKKRDNSHDMTVFGSENRGEGSVCLGKYFHHGYINHDPGGKSQRDGQYLRIELF